MKQVCEDLVILIYTEALQREQMQVALRTMVSYEDIILENDKRVLAPLIYSLKTSSYYMDSKLVMIRSFIPQIQFQYVDILVDKLQEIVNDSQSATGIFVCNINPFLVAIKILDICRLVKYHYPLAKMRI